MKTKICITFVFILIILTLFTVSASAFSYSFIDDGVGYSFPPNLEYKDYIFIFKYNGLSNGKPHYVYYSLITSDTPIIIDTEYSDNQEWISTTSASIEYNLYLYSPFRFS